MMQQVIIAKLAGVNQADVSNHEYGRSRYVTREKSERIEAIKRLSKARALLLWMSRGNTVTPLQSLQLFGLHSLSQTITRLKRQGHDIRNVGPKGPHDYAVYRLFTGEQK